MENYAKCVVSPLIGESETHRAALVGHFRKNCVQDWRLAILLTYAFMDLLHPIWYLTPVSDIPGRTFAHLRSAAVDMLKYPGLGHRLWQSDPGNFAISSPSAWNFLRIKLRDLGFSLITLRWKVYAFLFSSSAYLFVHQMLYIVFMCVNSRRLLFETICNSFLIIIITILLLNK